MLTLFAITLAAILAVSTAVTVTETPSLFTFANNYLSFDLIKTNGYIHNIIYQNTSLLGNVSGNAGQLYSDWPSNGFSLTGNSSYQIINSSAWAGIVLTDNNTATGGLVQRSWFLQDGESGLHSFLRLAYYNSAKPVQGPLGESRTMFRPSTGLWTHIVTNQEQWAPAPSAEALSKQVQVQDATWYLGDTPQDPYVVAESDYWTKYTFSDNQTNKAHGLYGTTSTGSYGAWWVVNQKDTYFGGPSHFDLMVDGIAYNKQSTSHGGASSPNVTSGFDRTFRPQFLYFNGGKTKASLQNLLADAEKYADPSWNSKFYDEIAPHASDRLCYYLQLQARISIPKGASKVTAVLSANKLHYQDSSLDPSAYQYWVEDVRNGAIEIDRVKSGTYRLTVYADGIFGDYTLDNVVINAGKTSALKNLKWTAESAGHELWRIGTPDKTSGEFRNGFEHDYAHPNTPAKYRIYWGAWDFPDQFPGGVNFTVGKSDYSKDWNYVHWSQFGPSHTRDNTVTNINRWQINFDLETAPSSTLTVTYTIQLAGATTTAGNTGQPQGAYPSFPISTYVNEEADPLNFPIVYYQSGSCAFPGSWLKQGANKFVLELPFGAAGIYVQYDALRLELRD